MSKQHLLGYVLMALGFAFLAIAAYGILFTTTTTTGTSVVRMQPYRYLVTPALVVGILVEVLGIVLAVLEGPKSNKNLESALQLQVESASDSSKTETTNAY